ncbi:thrombospondin type 3 repeat-containing protein [Oceanibium sediminis]|uniref:thrombospondin type 3 repeat-containing protein n=1 Tax=Oceanibium sediminis TaxID=2026339 RepID=UPI0018E5A257|nr:thrombospondin type 3 repeat-containing protein [Oceanibium sediminis]
MPSIRWLALAAAFALAGPLAQAPAQTPIISDYDADGVADPLDNCPGHANPMQDDADADGYGDACDSCDGIREAACPAPVPGMEELTLSDHLLSAARADSDGDGYSNLADLCPALPDPSQADRDGDLVGDACDACPDAPAPGLSNGCPPGGG